MKIKNIFRCIVAVIILGTIGNTELSVYAEDSNKEVSQKILDAFTEEDIQNGFQNYTENKYSYSLENELLRTVGELELENTNGKVIGAVYDNLTGKYLSNMQVYFKELDYSIVTGEGGRFEITGIPDGYYSVIISGDGYIDAIYENMPISHHTGTDIYSLAISKTNTVYEKIDLLHEYNVVEESFDTSIKECYNLNENDIQVASYTVPTLPVFSVNYKGTITKYGSMNYYYLYYVVASELLRPNSSVYSDLTDAEKLEGFKAQAIAARTYATTRAAWNLKHIADGYNFCSSTCCQVYNPTYTNTLTVQAVNDTHNRIVYDVINNRLCDTLFSASCLGETVSYYDWEGGGKNVSYLVSVDCEYDLRPSLDSGHNVGLCQDGAMGMAGQGMTCDEILMHYYTGTEVITANPNPIENPD